MKQVIFVCLLSISLCLSAPPNETPTDPAKHEDVLPPTEKAHTPPANTIPPANSPPQTNPAAPVNPPAHGTEVAPAQQSSVPAAPQGNTNANATTESNASPKNKDAPTITPTTNATEKANGNATSEKAPSAPSSTAPAGAPTVTVPPTNVNVSTKATPATEPEHKATVPPKIPEPVPVQARGFDGASFVGGIILTLGLLAIGFMGFKYYKNQTERNYHTL